MEKNCIRVIPNGLRRMGVRLLQVAALALIVAMALPGMAEDRAIKSRVPPTYPEMAKRMKIMGEVKVEVTIDASGTVTGTKPVSGNRMLSQAAEDAVKKWKFEAGTDVTTMTVAINFALN
jgi:TonB family protein